MSTANTAFAILNGISFGYRKPVTGRLQGSAIMMDPAPLVLLGFVAETKYAPVQLGSGVILSFAGLGLAFDVDTIRETIELLFL